MADVSVEVNEAMLLPLKRSSVVARPPVTYGVTSSHWRGVSLVMVTRVRKWCATRIVRTPVPTLLAASVAFQVMELSPRVR